MAKQISISCPPDMVVLLVDALRWFVARNYPHGADECSIAAREALLGLAKRFEQELMANGRCAYSSRVRAFLCEAVKGYTQYLEEREGRSYARRRALLIAVCRGLSGGEAYAVAEQCDVQTAPDVSS